VQCHVFVNSCSFNDIHNAETHGRVSVRIVVNYIHAIIILSAQVQCHVFVNSCSANDAHNAEQHGRVAVHMLSNHIHAIIILSA